MKNKTKKILILDSQYWYFLYKKLSKIKSFSFHVRWNTFDPIKYYEYIIKNNPDVIIMWTWYNNWLLQEPKWIILLKKILSYYWREVEEYKRKFLWIKFWKIIKYKLVWFNSKIIYICDMWKINIKKYSIFNYFENIVFIPDKDIKKIIETIKTN